MTEQKSCPTSVGFKELKSGFVDNLVGKLKKDTTVANIASLYPLPNSKNKKIFVYFKNTTSLQNKTS